MTLPTTRPLDACQLDAFNTSLRQLLATTATAWMTTLPAPAAVQRHD